MCSAQVHVRFTPNSDRKSGHAAIVMSALAPIMTTIAFFGMSALDQFCRTAGYADRSGRLRRYLVLLLRVLFAGYDQPPCLDECPCSRNG
jgi:hypothetical protein